MKNKGLIKFIIIFTAVVIVVIAMGKLDYKNNSKSNISIKERHHSYITEDNNRDGVRVKAEESGDSFKLLPVPDTSKEVIINQL